jgi:putative redox protein
MSKFTACARSIGGSLRHQVDVNGRHILVTDLPSYLGGTNAGPAPHELLAATLASCASTMVVLYGQSRNLNLDGLKVDVQYDADVAPRQLETAVHLPAGLTRREAEALRRVVETCPVRRAIEAGFTFRERFLFNHAARAA